MFSSKLQLFSVILIFFFSVTYGQMQPKPKSIFLPIRKDTDSLQYYTTLFLDKTTDDIYTEIDLVLDLGGQFTWFDCDSYSLPSYRKINCADKKCKVAGLVTCDGCDGNFGRSCADNGCGVLARNPFTNNLYSTVLGEGLTYIDSTDGVHYLLTYKAPNFQYSCIPSYFLKGLSSLTKGMTGLSRAPTSLNSQIALQFKLSNKFAICMTSTVGLGNLFIGGGPYYMSPYAKDISKELLKTPLINDGFFINVTSIKVDHKIVAINTSLLAINEQGEGGTKLSTLTPFTKLETTIYKALIKDFRRAAKSRKMRSVASVAPFEVCYSAKSVAKSQTGPVVPYIDLYLPSTHWRFYGANSMVAVNKDVLCLAFVDGGLEPVTSIVLGGHQMENYLIEFDLASSKLGFSTSLLFRNTTCAQTRFP